VSGSTLWEYVAFAAIVFVLPLALLACAGAASGGVSARLRSVALVLLVVGALVLLRQVLRTGAGELLLPIAAPILVAAGIVYPLAALTVVRSASGRIGRLTSAWSAVALLAAASVIQFAGPWMLISGK
jgi:hypothetical protein